MTTIPAPTLVISREEWPDADFDLPEGAPIHPPSDKEDEDWDIEMDFCKTGGAKANTAVAGLTSSSDLTSSIIASPMINIRPPLRTAVSEDDDEGVSTIKASMSTIVAKRAVQPKIEPVDEDFEDAFSLPAELTQLSLAPLSLSHRASKSSLEWGEKDNSSSSQSSDAYSSLGFAEASPSSNSTSSASLPDTETEEDEDELEGLVIPSSLFASGRSASHLKKILENKKNVQPQSKSTKPTRVDPEDDFEMGLIINDDVDLSPSRLVLNIQHPQRSTKRISSAPLQKPSVLRPPSRAKLERSKSPSNPPISSAKQFQKLRLSPSPPLQPPSRSQNFQALISSFQTASPSASPNSSLFPSKPGSLRGQKSHTGLKPPSPPSTRKLTRKASLSSLFEANHVQAPTSVHRPSEQKAARYEEPTAASRAKTHKTSISRNPDFKVPPTRPCTPALNTAALRLTMPTQSRLRSRPALSQVFSATLTPSQESPPQRAVSPIPSRPSSSSSLHVATVPRNQTQAPIAPKLLRRPKRPRTYGDGTELDHIEDLPTDRDKEVHYRVQPKGYGNRIPGATYALKAADKGKSIDNGTAGRKGKWESSIMNEPSIPYAPSVNTLRRTTAKIDFFDISVGPETSPKKKKKKSVNVPSNIGRRKPTLIRNLGGTSAPKVVGEMKWNPQTLRWEGNEQALRDFDAAVGTSTRPALITHLTCSSIGSPVGSFASGARIVGNMVFDPTRMCWMSTLPPEHDEPDVFANLADDEQDEWDRKGATIRANASRVSDASVATDSSEPGERSSPAPSHSRTISESGSDRGSRASMVVCDIDDAFIASCRKAEERHRVEMKGWKTSSSRREASLASDRSYLYEIRALATRQY